MDQKDWELLEVLAEEKSITQAAKRLFFSQLALSGKIKQLEKEFGCKIIIRGTRGISFTVQGELLIRYASRAQAELRELREQINNTNKEICGTLHIGCSYLISKYILPPLLKKFLQLYPQVNIQLKTAMSQEVFNMINNRQIQIGLLRGDYNWTGEKCLLQEDPICLVSSTPLALKNLPQLPQIHRPLDKPLQSAINNWWQSGYKQPPYIHMEVDTQDSCIQLVTEGLGYTILSELVSRDYPNLWHHRLEFPDGSLLTRKTHAYIQKEGQENRLIRAFFDFLCSCPPGNSQ